MSLTKVILSERDMPTHWYNINADLPRRVLLAARVAPWHRPAHRPGRSGAALSDGADCSGGQHRALH